MATPIPRNEAAFTWTELVGAVCGRIIHEGGAVRGVAIDSRAVEPGSLFIALRGERNDAHDFVPEAVHQGAAAVIVEREVAVPSSVGCIQVSSTTQALGELARAHRRRMPARVVALTGSVGKTSTKELLAAAVRAAGGPTLHTPGNLNNLIGVPMTLFGLSSEHAFAVIELGTSAPGEIRRLAEIVAPDVGLVTAIALAHSEGLGGLSDIAIEKTSLLDEVSRHGTVVLNADDPSQRAWADRLVAGLAPASVVLFGRAAEADVRLVGWTLESSPTVRTRCQLDVRGRRVDLSLALLGEAAARNASAALAAIVALDLDVSLAGAALEACTATPGRLSVVPSRLRLLVDDSYNANPTSTEVAVELLRELANALGARAILALGDMKELGSDTERSHREMGAKVARAEIDLFVAVGASMRFAAEAARAAGIEVIEAATSERAAAVLENELLATDALLVKGSRSMAMERIVERFAEAGASP